MAQNYKTGLIITGDASGGIRAIKATDDELGKLNKGFDRGSRRSKQFNQNVNATSQGLTVLKRAAAPLAGAIAGMFAANTIQNQIDWGDQLQKTNLRIGASTEALSQYNYVAKLSGVEFGQLTTAWQRQTRRIAEAAAGTGVASEALDRLGLSAQALNQLAPEEQFERIATAMQNVESSSERVALAQKLWDSEGVKLVQIVNQGTDAIAAMRAEADALGLTISQDTANAMATYNDEVDRLKFAAQGLSQTIAAEMIPSMTAGLQATSSFIHEIGGAETILDLTKDTATLLAGVLAGRLAGALATSTAGMVAAQAQSIRYQATLASMAGVSRAAAASQIALGAASRGASAAMMLVGGPAGAAVLAGLAIYSFRDELGLTIPQIDANTTAVDKLTAGLDDMSQAAAQLTLTSLVGQLAEVRAQAEVTAEAFTKVGQIEGDGGGGFLGVDVTAQTNAVRELGETSNATQQEAANLEAAIALVEERLGKLGDRNREVAPTITEVGDANETAAAKAKELAESTAAQAKALEDLYNRLRPGRRESVQLARDMNTLAVATAMGTGNIAQNIQMMGLLQQEHIEAQKRISETGDASEDASQRIANSFTSWGTIADNTLRSVDDSGRDAWLGLVDGSTSALDTIERAFEQTAANILHMLTTQKFTFQVAGMMGLDTTGMPGGGTGGGFNVGSMSSLKNGWDAVSGLWGGGATASGSLAMQGGLSSAALASAGQVAGGAAYSGALGSAASGAALGNAASGGFMSAASTAMPWVAGGMLVDEVLGLGIVDGIVSGISGLFGSSPTPFSGRFGTRDTAPAGTFEHQDSTSEQFYQQSAFGSVGFLDDGTERLQRAGTGNKEWAEELAVATAEIDNMTAALAPTNAEFEAMRGIVQGLETSSRSAADIVDFALNERPRAALEALDGHFGAFVRGLEGGIESVVQQAQVAQQAHSVLATGMERLNLQFDATGDGAYAAASSIAQWAGGVDQLASLQDSYYQNYFAESERAAHLQADLTESLAAMGLELPENEAGFRALVEAQNQNTEAGGRNYVQLLQLSSGFSQLQGMLGDTSKAADGAEESLDSAANALRERDSIETEWLRLIGDTTELRRRELAELDPSNRALQQRNWLFEDERKWLSEIEQRQQQRINNLSQESTALARARSELAGFGNSIDNWIAQFDATEQGMGTPRERLEASDADFWAQYEKALQGDRNAQQGITQYADRYIANLQEMYASSDPAVNGIDEIRDAMERLPEMLTPEQFLADEFRDVIEDQTVTLSDVLDLNADGTVSAIERAIAAEWNATQQLNNVLHHEMTQLGATVLTESEVRAALGPHATDAEISRLIARVDVNGDGMITRQELTNARIDSLGGGIATSIAPLFDQIDLDASGLINYSEFNKAFKGMATDSTLNEIFGLIDTNGDGQLSQLEAIAASSSTLVELWASQQPGDVQNAVSEISKMYENALGRAPDLPGIQYWIDEFLAGASLKTISDSINQHIGRDPGANTGGGGSTGGSTGGGSTTPPPTKTPRPFWERVVDANWSDIQRNVINSYRRSDQRAAAISYADSRNVKIPAYATGAWDLPRDHLAQVHAGELIAPSAGGIADEFRAYAAGEYQAELLTEIGKLQPPSGPMQLPMPEMPPLPQFPALGSADVLQVLNDVKRELMETRKESKSLQAENARLLEALGGAIEKHGNRSQRQRENQIDELQAINRNSKTRSKTP